MAIAHAPVTSGVMRKLLGFASVVEIATGVALLVTPGIVIGLLLGTSPAADALALARFLGIALLALGVACLPGGGVAQAPVAVVRAMLLYNALVAMLLAVLALVQHMGGVLLWPAVALHAAVAVGLAWQRSSRA